MANWLTTREAVKRSAGINGSEHDQKIDALIAAASAEVERALGRWFLPRTAVHRYRWPQRDSFDSWVLYLDADGHYGDLLAASALTKDDETATAIAAADYFLAPDAGPPYSKIEIDRSSSEFFSFKNTTQRAVRVTGRWGWSEDTEAAGNLNGALSSTTATALSLTRGDVVGVGDSLLIGSEMVFVTDRDVRDLGVNLSGALALSMATTTVTLSGAPTDAVRRGETLRINSEEMLIRSVTSTTVVEVQRAVNGTTLAAHANADDVYVQRDYTMQRGINGTTAATAADDAAVLHYAPDAAVATWVRALVAHRFLQESAHYAATGGAGDTQVEISGRALGVLAAAAQTLRRRNLVGSR